MSMLQHAHSQKKQATLRNLLEKTDSKSKSSFSIRRLSSAVRNSESYQSLEEFMMRFSPGGDLFWPRAVCCFVTAIGMQLIRGFGLDFVDLEVDNYAQIDADRTMWQTSLIIIHIWLFLYAYYKGSEIMYFLVDFILEMGYLIVRVSLQGPLSMATTSFIDFLTIAFALFWQVFEVGELSEFILNYNRRVNPSSSRLLKWAFIAVGLVCTGLGGMVIGFCIYKEYIQGCPSVDPTESIDVAAGDELWGDLHKLQFQMSLGVYCFAWVFNLYLSPGCSCYFLQLVPFDAPGSGFSSGSEENTCVGFGNNNHTYIKDFLPHFTQLRFLFTDMPYADECATNEQDLDLIASWTHLRVIRLFGFRFPEFPQSWKALENLVSLELMTSRIQRLDEDVFNSWGMLEYFACTSCPHLETIRSLQNTNLPRLSQVEVYGVHECSNLSQDVNLVCVPLDEPPQCPGIPEFYLRVFVDTTANTQTGQCTQPACSSFLKIFDRRDELADGIVEANEFNSFNLMRLYEMNYTISGFGGRRLSHNSDMYTDYFSINHTVMSCLAQKTWEAMPFAVNISGYDIADGWPIASYVAADFRYTMCTECQGYQERLAASYDFYKLRNTGQPNISESCREVAANNNNVNFELVNLLCQSTDHSCDSMCGMALPLLLMGDANGDTYIDPETEFNLDAAGAAGLTQATAVQVK